MLTWSGFVDVPPVTDEPVDARQRRHDLQARSLLDSPELRRAMGLPPITEAGGTDVPASVVVPIEVPPRQQAVTRRPPRPAARPRATQAPANRTSSPRARQHPRFDRRALLESDRAS